jgi:iron complex outermembrane receptor protein
MMKISTLSLAIALLSTAPAFAAEKEAPSAETIVVTASRTTATNSGVEAEDEISTAPDGAAFLARQPESR